jgi:hypothetical protein
MEKKSTIIIRSGGFDDLLKTSKYRSIKNEVEREITTLTENAGIGQRICKNLFEKRIKDDFRLYYFKYEFSGRTIIAVFLLLISKKKHQEEDIKNLKKDYEEKYNFYRREIMKKFKL